MRRFIIKEQAWIMLLAPMLMGLFSASPLSAQSTYYIDASSGNDNHNNVQARSPTTPWRTINRWINDEFALAGDTVIVKPGTYNESVDLKHPLVTLKAEPRRGATIQPPSGQGVLVDGLVGVTVEGFIVQGGSTGISFIAAHDGTVRDNVVHSSAVNGINFRDSSNGVIENNIVHSNGLGNDGMGIKYEGGDNGKVRNNLVYNNGSWGISLEPDPTSTDNRIQSNTVDRNLNGVRLLSGGGTIFDNIITNNGTRGLHLQSLTGVQEDHNNVSGHSEDFDFIAGPHTISVDPLYVDPDGADNALGGAGWQDDSYHLSQTAAGQSADSLCVNAGSELTEDSDIAGSTATDNFPDEDTLDMGFHYAIFRSTMKVFSLTSIKNAIEKKAGQFKATYNLLGKVALGNDSNGIDPDTQRVRVEIDTYSQTLPLGACKQRSSKVWDCSGPSPGVTFLKIDLAKGSFEVIAKALPAPASPLATNVRLRVFIGDDIGVADMLYVRGTLFAP